MRAGIGAIAGVVGMVATSGAVATSGYLGTLTAASLLPRPPSSPTSRDHRFAIIIPAYNEADVIERTLDSLRALDYPTDLFEAHVVADNCTDDTADIVRRAGFLAHERVDAENPGKGAALNWLVSRIEADLQARSTSLDAYIVVDADTVLDPEFLVAMAAAVESGARVAQGHYSVLDPDSSASAGLRYAALACRHYVRPLGRTRLGGSCGLYGTGMLISRDLMTAHQWSNHLVEDAEFQMELLLRDICVSYVPDARLWAEMPDSIDASTTQNERWELGRIQVARRYVPQLVQRLRARRTSRQLAHLDAIADHLVPPLSVLVALQVAAVGTTQAASALSPSPSRRRSASWACASFAVLIAHVLIALISVRAPRSVYLSLLGAPRAVVWKLRLWMRMTSTSDLAWQRTERNQAAADDHRAEAS